MGEEPEVTHPTKEASFLEQCKWAYWDWARFAVFLNSRRLIRRQHEHAETQLLSLRLEPRAEASERELLR